VSRQAEHGGVQSAVAEVLPVAEQHVRSKRSKLPMPAAESVIRATAVATLEPPEPQNMSPLSVFSKSPACIAMGASQAFRRYAQLPAWSMWPLREEDETQASRLAVGATQPRLEVLAP